MDKDYLIEQLIYFYYNYDKFQTSYLEEFVIRIYYDSILSKNLISYDTDVFGRLKGFVEYWRINYEQFGRIICFKPVNIINVFQEDIRNGNICYLANITIHPDYRKTETIKVLRNKFFEANHHCEFFVGNALRKKTQPIKVFSRQLFYDKYKPEKEELKLGEVI